MKLPVKIKAYLLRKITIKHSTDFDLQKASNVLFFRYDRIGDMVITTPVFRELKRAYPDIEISVLASKFNYLVIKNNPNVDKVYLNDKNNFFSDLPTLLKLRRQKIDVCIEFDHSIVRHAILRLKIIKPKRVISIQKYSRYGVNASELELYDFYTERFINSHFRDIWLNTLLPFGVRPLSNKYEIYLDNQNEKQAKSYLKEFNGKLLVGVNLEGAVKGKKIQFQYLYEICIELFKVNKNIHIFIIHSPEKENAILEQLRKMNLNYVTKSYKTYDVLSLSALIKNLDIIITPDTSVAHIASTFNKPVVTIHEDNLDSFKLFAPTSDIRRTIFSNQGNSLEIFSVKQLIKATEEIMSSFSSEQSKLKEGR